MKEKYVVQQCFYDSGRVRIIPPRKTDECLNSIEVMRSCVFCRDVFSTLQKAKQFYYECLNEFSPVSVTGNVTGNAGNVSGNVSIVGNASETQEVTGKATQLLR
jgi:hypothetical protein